MRAFLSSQSVLVVVAVAILLAGCRGTPKTFTTPYKSFGAFYPETTEHLAEVLRERHPSLSTIQAQFGVTIDAGEQGKRSFDANLLVEFPDKARLRGSRAIIGTFFDIISVGDVLHIYFNRDGVLFSGQRSDLDPSAGLLRLVGPDELMRALLAERDLSARLQKPGHWRVRDQISHWSIWAETPGGGWQVWVVRKQDFLVEETIISRTGDAATARIRYWSYELVDGEPMPWVLEIHLADPEVTVFIELDKVRMNPPLRLQTFIPPAVDNEHWYPLSQLRLDPIQEE